jgi:hypothetical protein
VSHVYHFTSTDKDGKKMEMRVEIDVNAIAAKLAPRLRRSKLGRTVSMDGAVTATRVKEPQCLSQQTRHGSDDDVA